MDLLKPGKLFVKGKLSKVVELRHSPRTIIGCDNNSRWFSSLLLLYCYFRVVWSLKSRLVILNFSYKPSKDGCFYSGM